MRKRWDRSKGYIGLAVVITAIFLGMTLQLSQTAVTGLAYTKDPTSDHYSRFADSPVIYTSNADGQTFTFSISPCGSAIGSVNGGRLIMGGFKSCFESAAPGTRFTVSAPHVAGMASCTLEMVGPYRYCGVVPPSRQTATSTPDLASRE